MQFWQAIVLGLVQGLAEFLPISSSGHLALVQNLLGLDGDYLLFDILLHVGTLGAVCVYFFKDIVDLFKPPFKKMGLLVIATVPAALCGLLFDDFVDELVGNGKYLCFFFLITAILLVLTEYLGKKKPCDKPLGIKTALSMGLMQAVGIFPGVSRSGSTIFGGILSGTEKESVATFSFLMSIPMILGSAAVETYHVVKAGGVAFDLFPTIGGMLAAFISGYFAVKWMMALVKKADFKWFAVYTAALSVATFIWLFL